MGFSWLFLSPYEFLFTSFLDLITFSIKVRMEWLWSDRTFFFLKFSLQLMNFILLPPYCLTLWLNVVCNLEETGWHEDGFKAIKVIQKHVVPLVFGVVGFWTYLNQKCYDCKTGESGYRLYLYVLRLQCMMQITWIAYEMCCLGNPCLIWQTLALVLNDACWTQGHFKFVELLTRVSNAMLSSAIRHCC